MIPAFVGLSIAIWALITGHMADKWVVPVSVGLVHIFMPVTMGLPWFALLGAIDVKFPPKKNN